MNPSGYPAEVFPLQGGRQGGFPGQPSAPTMVQYTTVNVTAEPPPGPHHLVPLLLCLLKPFLPRTGSAHLLVQGELTCDCSDLLMNDILCVPIFCYFLVLVISNICTVHVISNSHRVF